MRLWGIVIVLILATVAGILMSRDPGYSLFAYGNTTVEMPLWLSIIFICGLVIALTTGLFILTSIFGGFHKIPYWWSKRRKDAARLQTYRGLLELSEGRWKKAERYLIKGAALSDTPYINYLSAAKAAEESGFAKKRDDYLQLALKANKDSDVAISLTEAKLQLKRGELQQSVETLERLLKKKPKHNKILRLLSTLYPTQENWEAMYDIMPLLKKQNVLSEIEIAKLEEKTYNALFPKYAAKGLKPLMQFWQHAPKTIQQNPLFVFQYARSLYSLNAHEEAQAIIESTLKKNWDDSLIRIYGLVQGRHPKHQLEFAEQFLSRHFDNPWLLQCLGRLCVINQLWGKARDYLEQSLSLKPEPETYAELGQLMDRLGMKEKRDEYFKKGLLLAVSDFRRN